MKGHVLSYGCACLCSGEGIPSLSLRRDMPYSNDTSSCSVNHLLKRIKVYGLSIAPWCSRCLQQLLSRYFLQKSEEYNGLGDSSRLGMETRLGLGHSVVPLSTLTRSYVVHHDFSPSKSLGRCHRCHISVLYTERPPRTLLQLLSKARSENSQILY